MPETRILAAYANGSTATRGEGLLVGAAGQLRGVACSRARSARIGGSGRTRPLGRCEPSAALPCAYERPFAAARGWRELLGWTTWRGTHRGREVGGIRRGTPRTPAPARRPARRPRRARRVDPALPVGGDHLPADGGGAALARGFMRLAVERARGEAPRVPHVTVREVPSCSARRVCWGRHTSGGDTHAASKTDNTIFRVRRGPP